jgi:DNA-binding beta-propeller fold protein YncE
VDPQTRRVFALDRQSGRVQVFDENGKYLNEWSFGPRPPSDIHTFMIDSNRFLWAADQGTSKMLKYDLDGHFLYQWGTAGDEATGEFWGTHGVSVDPDGNFYTAEVFRGGFQKFRPRPGANPAFLVGRAQNPGWPR